MFNDFFQCIFCINYNLENTQFLASTTIQNQMCHHIQTILKMMRFDNYCGLQSYFNRQRDYLFKCFRIFKCLRMEKNLIVDVLYKYFEMLPKKLNICRLYKVIATEILKPIFRETRMFTI